MEQNKISYNFTPVPTQLMLLCDVNVRSALFTMVELSNMFADEKGIFFRTNSDLQDDMKLSKNLVVATIDALYQNGLIDVFVSENHRQGKKTPSNKYRVKFDEFKRFETLSFNDLKNPDNFIETANYYVKGYKPSYLSNTLSTTSPNTSSNTSSKIDDNIETIDTIETKETINSNIISGLIKEENINQGIYQGEIDTSTSKDISLNQTDKIEENKQTSTLKNSLTSTLEENNTNVTSTSNSIKESSPVELDKSIPTEEKIEVKQPSTGKNEESNLISTGENSQISNQENRSISTNDPSLTSTGTNEITITPTARKIEVNQEELKEFDKMILSKIDTGKFISTSELNSFLLSVERYLKAGGELKNIKRYNVRVKPIIEKYRDTGKLDISADMTIESIYRIIETSNKLKQRSLETISA